MKYEKTKNEGERMKDSYQFLTDNYSLLTQNEKCVADYIMLHFSDAIEMNVSELAQKCGVSAATPVRLAQRLGFDGYTAFRLHLAKGTPKASEDLLDLDKEDLAQADAVEKVLNAEMDTVRLTAKQIDHAMLRSVANKIHDAGRILFFGCGTSYLAAVDSAYKFTRVGKTVFYTENFEQSLILLSSFTKNDLLICITHSGEHSDVCGALSFAKSHGISTCVFSAFAKSTAALTADFLIKTETRESPLHKIAFTSRISQLAAADSLFATYYVTYAEECARHLTAIAENTRKIH